MEGTDYKPLSRVEKEAAVRVGGIELNGGHLESSPFRSLDPHLFPDMIAGTERGDWGCR